MAKRKETVTRVIDGDTFITSSRKRVVRVANVDAPEKGTKAGDRAAQRLRNLIEGKKVEIETVARDVFGRTVARVKVGGRSLKTALKRNSKR